ncbi:MAG TPA: flagellar motor protein MotB [Flavobacteriaceae bacterium]|nr:flagellar motor protein MotB [Flavobacteriaceae bacterium]
MRKLLVLPLTLSLVLATSCVSKKKYTELENKYDHTTSTLVKTTQEKEEAEAKLARIEDRVSDYNAKIRSLTDSNSKKLENLDGVVVSDEMKSKMRAALADIDQDELKDARTLKDSMSVLISHNLKKGLDSSFSDENEEDVKISIDETVVMISVSDKLLFNSGSAVVSSKANSLLQRLADLINSEPAMEVLVEGHTDGQSVKPGSYVRDNWELSVLRSTAVIRKLENSFDVDPKKLIAAGRSSYMPIASNDSVEGRAKNRRTRIVILPNLDKFLAMLSEESN